MNCDEWLERLARELRGAGVDPATAEQVVAESRAHLRDADAEPEQVFGPAGAYARAVAASLDVTRARRRPHPRRHPGAPRQVRLQARGVSKTFKRRRVLCDVDLTVHAGEVAAVVGANGSGKSTLLRICAGLLAPDRGEVVVDGVLGYCPQDTGLCDLLLPDEHFVLIGAGRDMTRTQARRDGARFAGELSWAPDTATLARDLSGGTRQKLNVALATMGEPDVLLLDEPYQGFDRGAYLDFWDVVWGWRDAGRAIVVVTHMLNQLDRADTVLDLSGTLVGEPAS